MTNSVPIVVLNLKKRPERWEAWVQEAEKNKLENYSRWEAIDGSLVTITPEIQQLFKDNDFNMRRGVMGCALSHLNIWLHIVEEKLPALIVFEDDARFNETFCLPDLPRGWDIFYFGGPSLKGVYPPGIPFNEKVIIPKLDPDLYFTTIAYMLSFSGACKLLDRLDKVGFNRAVDWFMRDTFDQLNVFCYKKLIIYADEKGDSDVQL